MTAPAPPPPDPRVLDRAAELIKAASRPVVIAGQQCRPEDAGWVGAFVEALPAPLLTTAQAKGVFPEAHPLALGIVTGGDQDDAVLGLADLIVTFGLDPEELNLGRWPYAAVVAHVSRTPHSDYPFTPLVEVVGDLSLILEELAPRIRGKTQADWDMFQLDRLKKAQRG